jgi:hypothetical protein
MTEKSRITAANKRETPAAPPASQKEAVGATADPPAAAKRALAEAEARRNKSKAQDDRSAKEIGGRGGLDPARYGDWEVKGIASDF